MAFPYIDTPRTQIDGNATYLTNGSRSAARHNLSVLDSIEDSFQSPLKDNDILKETNSSRNRARRSYALRTPGVDQRSRSSRPRKNLPPVAPQKGEFTPLMKSVTKNNFLRNGARTRGVPNTPVHLKDGYHEQDTPGLPRIDESQLYEGGSLNSVDYNDEITPVPQAADSSTHSTPLATLPARDGAGGILGDGHNIMTLKEQENVIDKLNKENFNLKIRIHYLEEQARKAGPELNHTALKENTELKVNKVAMQRDLHRCRKSLIHAERDLEACHLELKELQEKLARRQADKSLQQELDWTREEIETKETIIKRLREEIMATEQKGTDEIEKLREDIASLEFDLREKDRELDLKEEQIEILQAKVPEDPNTVHKLETELEHAKEQIEELQETLNQASAESHEAQTACQEAQQQKERAIEDLKELQDEMANKSFTTPGLSRQLEEKVDNLETDADDLRHQNATLQRELESKERLERRLQERIQSIEEELESQKTKMQDIELLDQEHNIAVRERDSALIRVQELNDELQQNGDAKSLLQHRHDMLMNESKGLQDDLARAKRIIEELEEQALIEQQQAIDALNDLRSCKTTEIDRLNDEIDQVRADFNKKVSQFNFDRDEWAHMKRKLELQRDQAEQQSEGHKRSIDRLQQIEITESGREQKLQDMIENEKKRYQQQEELLNRQIQELNNDISSRRQTSEAHRTELFNLKEELRISRREEEVMREKIQALEDEIIVLQASAEEEQRFATAHKKTDASESANHLQTITRERQALREQLANTKLEFNEHRVLMGEMEAERDELQSQLRQYQNQTDSTHKLDQEKLELRKVKLRLEAEITRLKKEKDLLQDANHTLLRDLDSEISRAASEEAQLAAEIDQLQDKIFIAGEKRDSELLSARSKAIRLESRIKDLEACLQNPEPTPSNSSPKSLDSSVLRNSLNESRAREITARKREADLKSSIKDLKSHILDLERENHDLQTKKFDHLSPASSPSSRLQEEIRSLREQLLAAHKAAKDLRLRNQELQQTIVKEDERKDLHELLKSSTIEAESLALKLSERDSRINELRLNLRRLREERSAALKKADAADYKLQSLQDRYEKTFDDFSNRSQRNSRHDKELKGLSKEILWLRARLVRTEQFRRDLAWSKGLMELGEQVRVACNETDLKMIAEMGVETEKAPSTSNARRRFKVVAVAALAAARMQKMASEWAKSRKLGEDLRRVKREAMKRREDSKRAEMG
ncbi:hypothetical protein FQN57_004956 [Myotisia sp. PD_48]|nr:hypothetical protein FQN57_004956 [Myotisia sp. PD_48]